MNLTFLEANVPLTKSYEKSDRDGSYKGSSYPDAYRVTSYVEEINNLGEFTDALQKHAAAGRCLLTNSLSHAIVKESRAKLSIKDELRTWVLLDIDGIEGIASAEEFIIKLMPVPFHNVSYIIQHSPSSGIKPGSRLIFLSFHVRHGFH